MKMEVAIRPQTGVQATFGGTAVNRQDATNGGASAVLHVACGIAEGAPSTQSVNGKLQHSVDGSTAWSDLGVAIPELTNDTEDASSPNINLSGKRKFLRSVITIAFTGGSTPKIPFAATICFGGRE